MKFPFNRGCCILPGNSISTEQEFPVQQVSALVPYWDTFSLYIVSAVKLLLVKICKQEIRDLWKPSKLSEVRAQSCRYSVQIQVHLMPRCGLCPSGQWFSASLTLRPWNRLPHVVVTSSHKIIFVVTVMNYNVTIFWRQRYTKGHHPQGENLWSRGSLLKQ